MVGNGRSEQPDAKRLFYYGLTFDTNLDERSRLSPLPPSTFNPSIKLRALRVANLRARSEGAAKDRETSARVRRKDSRSGIIGYTRS